MSESLKPPQTDEEPLRLAQPSARAPARSWMPSHAAPHLSGAMWSMERRGGLGVMPHYEDKLERYQHISLLGEGGMGQVWLGWDAQLERNVAIKQPKGDAHSHQANRLTYEAMITAKLEHPGIVSIHDVFFDAQRPHFVMKLICGQPLGHLVSTHHQSQVSHTTPPTALVRRLLEACEAMGYAHRMGVVHRDLSPMNILIGDDGATHIIDWGLAVRMTEVGEHTDYVGTPGYIAPEQGRDKQYGPRSDVWSLGALLHDVLYGCAPLPHEDIAGRASAWPELHAIVVCALQEEPTQRYKDATEMAEDLQRWFEGNRVRAYQVTLWGTMRRAMRVYKKRLFGGVLVFVAFLGVIGVGVVRTRQETDRALEAEALATRRERQAQSESVEARKAAAQLIQADAAIRATQQDLVWAKRLAIKSLSTYDTPEARGLLAAIAMQPEPFMQVLHELPYCNQSRWMLTPHSHLALCSRGTTESGTLLTQWDLRTQTEAWAYHATPYTETCGIGQLAITSQRVLTIAHPHHRCTHGHLAFDLESGEPIVHEQGFEHSTFFLSSGGLRAGWRKQMLLDYPQSLGLCDVKILNAHQDARGNVWIICNSYDIWRLTVNADDFEHMPISPTDSTHIMASTKAHDQVWALSSQGQLFSLGDTHLSWAFGETAQKMMFLPNSPLLAILGMRGKLRVFDTQLLTWRFTMPGKYDDIYADPGLGLRAIRHDGKVIQWTFSPNPPIGRYQGSAGFSMAAWSRDQDLILGVDGSGDAHMFAPFQGRRWPAKSWNIGVGKWVSASQRTNTFAFVGIQAQGVHRGGVTDDTFDVHIDPRYDSHEQTRKRILLSPQDHAMHIYYGAEDVLIERPNSQPSTRIDLNQGATVSGADTSSQLNRVTILADKNVVVWDWKSDTSTLVHTHDNTAQAVSVNEQGDVLVIDAQHMLVFDATQQRRARWKIEGARILDVEWVPNQARAVLGHLDGSMTLWNTNTGELLARGTQHKERVTKLDVSRNGRWVLTTSWDGALVLWDLEIAQRELGVLLNDPQFH